MRLIEPENHFWKLPEKAKKCENDQGFSWMSNIMAKTKDVSSIMKYKYFWVFGVVTKAKS